MVKIILLCSSSQANALLDNVAPTYQAVNTKTTSKHRVWGLARLVLRILEPQEICILLLETPHNDLSTAALQKVLSVGEKKSGKYFQVYILGVVGEVF